MYAKIALLSLVLSLFFLPTNTLPSSIDVYFCPNDDCETVFIETLLTAKKSVTCALYELKLDSIVEVFDHLSEFLPVFILIDKDEIYYNRSYIYPDKNSALMHNKICVIDGSTVITGSTNVAPNDIFRNRNNLIVLFSASLSRQFETYIFEISQRHSRQRYQSHIVDDIPIEAFFCPDDFCAKRLMALIQSAQESIYFATFSFTDVSIAKELLLAQKRGVFVSGIYEHRMHTVHSTYQLLSYQHMNVRTDSGISTLHHKFFVIDEEIVFTGSYNPTLNGNTRNDENVLIIHDLGIARLFINEFYSIE